MWNGQKIGALAAQTAIAKRSRSFSTGAGRRFHGKVKALADAAREAGLKF